MALLYIILNMIGFLFQSVTQAYLEKENSGSPNRSRTYDLPSQVRMFYRWATGDLWELGHNIKFISQTPLIDIQILPVCSLMALAPTSLL